MENLKKPDESLGDYDILKLSKNETNNLNRSINRKKDLISDKSLHTKEAQDQIDSFQDSIKTSERNYH